MLDYKSFTHPSDLCGWVNNNPRTVNVHSITIDEFGKFILFYSYSSSNSEKPIPDYDPEEIYKAMRKQESRIRR